MARISGFALLALLTSGPAAPATAAEPPGQLRFVEELRFEPSKEGTRIGAELQRLDPQRFLKVGMEWERDAKKRPLRPRFKVLDLAQRKVVDLVIPLDQLPKPHLELLGAAPPPELVHHDGERTSMVFRESRNYKSVAKHFCQYDHRTGRFSDLVKLGPEDDRRYLHPIGFDPQEAYFYFAFELYAPEDKEKRGPAALELARIGLKDLAVDWELRLDLPQRKRQLQIKEKRFSHDGTKLAFVEHSERSYPPAIPPQRVYVIDLAARKAAFYPTPFSTYGLAFSRDDRHLFLGSNELGEIHRVDLVKKVVDLKKKSLGLIQGFALTPSGGTLLVFANTILGSAKVVEVRRTDTLALKTSIPVRLLFPGLDGVHPGFVSTQDGRTLVAPIPEKSGFPAGTGVRIYEVPDDVDSPATAGTSAEGLEIAQGVVAAKQHAAGSRIELETDAAEEARTPRPSFAPIVVTPSGDVVFTGTRSGNRDGDYKPGRTTPVVVRLDAAGKKRWEVALPKPGFLDHTGARVAATADGGCIAQLYSYVHPGQTPRTRLVRLDQKGTVRWDLLLPGEAGPATAIGDRFDLRGDGTIAVVGRVSTASGADRWSVLVGPDGKVLPGVTAE